MTGTFSKKRIDPAGRVVTLFTQNNIITKLLFTGRRNMVSENDVLHIAELADIGIATSELGKFTEQFKAILEYCDMLDTLAAEDELDRPLVNVFREDELRPSLTQEEALVNSHKPEDGYIRAPKVI